MSTIAFDQFALTRIADFARSLSRLHQASRRRLVDDDAIERAHAIVSSLDSDDQVLLSASLDEISLAIHAKLLQQFYLSYPGFEEEAQVWHGLRM